MYISSFLLFLPRLASATFPQQPQHIFANPEEDDGIFTIPTSYESAVMARRVLNLTPLGTLSTIFPSMSNSLEQRPSGVQGMPIGLMDYIADCENKGNPTILAISIATSFKNAAAGSNLSLSLQWTPPFPPSSRISVFTEGGAVPYSAANLPRFSLLGYLERIPEAEVEALDIANCFTKAHQDAKYWLPSNRIHASEWMRLVVQDIYWIGGFGDRAYIGWIPIEEWSKVTTSEWQSIRLPGEKKGWKEWSTEQHEKDI